MCKNKLTSKLDLPNKVNSDGALTSWPATRRGHAPRPTGVYQ